MNLNIKQLLTFELCHILDGPILPGLICGHMGVVLTIANCSKLERMTYLDIVCEYLLEKIFNKLGTTSDISFEKGLTGVGWGIEYLIQNNLMIGDSNELCRDIDDKIMNYDLDRMNIDDLLGVQHYVLARIQGNIMSSRIIPFNSLYMSKLYQLLSVQSILDNSLAHIVENGCKDIKIKQLTINAIMTSVNEINYKSLSLKNGISGYIMTKFFPQL